MIVPALLRIARGARSSGRPFGRLAQAAVTLLVLLSSGCQAVPKNAPREAFKASLDRDWKPNHAVLPEVDIEGERVTLRNVRNSRYLTEDDYIVQHYDLEFDLRDVQSVDYLVVPFRSAESLAHTMLSFGLRDGRHFIVSVEARMEEGESYDPLLGSLRQYELMYIVGDERDLIPLRTRIRNLDVYVYRSTAPPARVQELLQQMLARVRKLEQQPEFYDTLTNNCTSNIVRHINQLENGRRIPWDVRVLLPGYSDQLAYELGWIERQGTFAETRAAARVKDAANGSAATGPEFSRRIRR